MQEIRDAALIPGLGRSPGGGNGNPFQYSCLKNPTNREEPGKPQSMGSQRVGHDWAHTHAPTQWKVRLWNTLRHSLKVKGVRCLPPTPQICIAQLDTANGSAIISSGKAIMAVFTGHNHFTVASFFALSRGIWDLSSWTRNQTYIPYTESMGS